MSLKEDTKLVDFFLDFFKKNQTGHVERLWLFGFGVNWQDEETGDTPLHIAVSNQSTNLARTILEQYGVDLTIKNKEGKTALDIARDLGDDSMILKLETAIKHESGKADPN